MKRLSLLPVILLSLSGCFGNSATDNTTIGQVKRAHHETPILCLHYNDIDLSLGVIRNGVGSVSAQDILLYVPNQQDYDLLQQASQTGQLVKVTYDEARVHWCVEDYTVTHVEISQ